MRKVDDEIDIAETFHKLWKKRKFIIKITGIFVAIGLFIALFSPVTYTAFCTMVPQTGDKSTDSNIGGLAAIVGINMNNRITGSILSPRVYPKIVSNINFQKELIYSKFHFKGVAQPITLYDYYTDSKYRRFNIITTLKTYTIGLPGLIISGVASLFEDKEEIDVNGNITKTDTGSKTSQSEITSTPAVLSLTSTETSVQRIVGSNLSLIVNSKEGYITLSASMPEKLASAEVTQRTQELLQKYITEFKIEKVASNLAFVERSYQEAKGNFETKQGELARFRDANKSFSSAVAKTHEEKLMSEYSLLLGVYTELSKQKEQAKIAVTETTPILTIVEPVVVPIERSSPRRMVILLIITSLGFIIGSGLVLFEPFLRKSRKPAVKND